MIRPLLALAALACGAALTHAHFVFVIPQKGGQSVQVVFSDQLAPDEGVPITKIAGTRLYARAPGGKPTPLTLEKGKNAYTAKLADSGARIVHGLTDYGVLQKGKERPYLLRYHPKAIVGPVPADGGKLGDSAALEIVPSIDRGKVRFQVLAAGKPVPAAEVTVLLPGGDSKQLKADAAGQTEAVAAKGQVGAWARHVVKAAGKNNGKPYDEARHYATLVFDVAPGK